MGVGDEAVAQIIDGVLDGAGEDIVSLGVMIDLQPLHIGLAASGVRYPESCPANRSGRG